MPKDERSHAPKAGPFSRPPLPMPAVGAMPNGQELYVGRGGQWAIGRVVRWFGEADDSDHWYELAFAPRGGATEWFDLAPARRAIGTAATGSWAFLEDEDITGCAADARRRGDGAAAAQAPKPRKQRATAGAGGAQAQEHTCPHCAAVFGRAGHVTTHVRTVHEKRRDYACPHCVAAFGHASSLVTHVRTVHEKRRDHACPH